MKNLYLITLSFFLLCCARDGYAQINCSISIADKSGCAPFAILATANDNSPYPILERRWRLNNQSGQLVYSTPIAPNANQNFSYIIASDTCAEFYLSLWSKNTNGDTCVAYDTVFVAGKPKLQPLLAANCNSTPKTVTLYPNATTCAGVLDTFVVDWGCGPPDILGYVPNSLTHTYNCPDSCYDVTIVTRNSYGCFTDTTLYDVCLNTPVTAGGYISADTVNCPNPPFYVYYTDTSSAHTSGTWDFGDGISSAIDTTYHLYTLPGKYVVRRVVCSGVCCDTAIIDTVVVSGPYLANYNLSLSGLCACRDTLHLNIEVVGAESATVLFGCNQGFQTYNNLPAGTDLSPTELDAYIQYCLTDSCEIQIILTDTFGCSVFYNLPWVYVDTPTVFFKIERQNACIDGNFCFEDLSNYATGTDSTVSWLWNFGDGTTDTVQNPCHYYNTEGKYVVTLSVTSANGCMASYLDTVRNYLSLNPQASFTWTILSMTGQPQFTNTSTGGFTNVHWNFGDGISYNVPDTMSVVNHHYGFGSYLVTLTISDSTGCVDSFQAYANSLQGIEETEMKSVWVKAIPNPFKDFTTIQIEGVSEGFDFTVINLLGEKLLVKQGKPNEPLRIERNNLPAGVYLYEVTTQSGLKATGKLMIE